MRKILFRAKTVFSSEWVESMSITNGTIKRKERNFYFEIGNDKWTQVREDTICQFTGLIDRFKNKIFDGDIIKYTEHQGYLLKSFTAEIRWIESYACFGYNKVEKDESGFEDVIIHSFSEHEEFEIDVLPFIEVIGNKYDNPELMCA